ncbi:MAG TPA: hypothetical protein PLS81_02785 [Deltaproteobacteria bacterium]|nr:hypothetical protein [Deltaproteobacteria bacterium]HOM28368.1 hypothetical protein [Deltaproteobacteria bacterium]HPP80022.1 hypothetical protein [Deltaproteobacteria bacterium]
MEIGEEQQGRYFIFEDEVSAEMTGYFLPAMNASAHAGYHLSQQVGSFSNY